MATVVPLVGLLMISGAFAGVLAGMLGVGGGIVHVPAFLFVFSTLGHDGPQVMQVCLATSLAAIVITSLRSVAAHHKKAAVDWQILRSWAPGIILGALLGVLVAARLRSDQLELLFAVLAALVACYLLFGRSTWRIGAAMPGPGPRMVMSPAVGFLSVLMGIGGGSFGVPLMTLYGVPIHRAVATAAGFGALIALPSVAAFLLMSVQSPPPFTIGAVNLPAFAIAVSMTLITAPIGAVIAHRLPPLVLRRVFGGFVLLVAANMLRQVLWS